MFSSSNKMVYVKPLDTQRDFRAALSRSTYARESDRTELQLLRNKKAARANADLLSYITDNKMDAAGLTDNHSHFGASPLFAETNCRGDPKGVP